MPQTLVIVGALARIEVAEADQVRERLSGLRGVDTFDLAEPEKLGVLIEAEGLEAAHDVLQKQVRTAPGVLAVWPVSVEMDSNT